MQCTHKTTNNKQTATINIMKLTSAAILLLSNSGVSANPCSKKCKNVFSRSITQVLTSCVEACEVGGEVCYNFCEQYVSDTELCQDIFCEGQRVERKANLRSGAHGAFDQNADVDLGILNSKDLSFVEDAVEVNNPYYDDDFSFGGIDCFNQCSSLSGKIAYFNCLDKCFGTGDANNQLSLASSKINVKEESQFGSQCVRECRGGPRSRYGDCIARCYGLPSYCHYECFDETNSDASYRRCVELNCGSNEVGSGNLGLFVKKISAHVMK